MLIIAGKNSKMFWFYLVLVPSFFLILFYFLRKKMFESLDQDYLLKMVEQGKINKIEIFYMNEQIASKGALEDLHNLFLSGTVVFYVTNQK